MPPAVQPPDWLPTCSRSTNEGRAASMTSFPSSRLAASWCRASAAFTCPPGFAGSCTCQHSQQASPLPTVPGPAAACWSCGAMTVMPRQHGRHTGMLAQLQGAGVCLTWPEAAGASHGAQAQLNICHGVAIYRAGPPSTGPWHHTMHCRYIRCMLCTTSSQAGERPC